MFRGFNRFLNVTLHVARSSSSFAHSALLSNSHISSNTSRSLITPTLYIDYKKQWEETDNLIYTDLNLKQYTLLREVIHNFNKNENDSLKELINSETVVDSFMKNPQNWSIIHDYIPNSYKIENLDLFIANNLMSTVESVQKKDTTKKSIKSFVDIAESYNSFFLKKFYKVECQSDLQGLAMTHNLLRYLLNYTSVICNYLDQETKLRGRLPSSKNFETLNFYTNLLMSNFTCLDEVPPGLAAQFYKLFCHDKAKWLFSAEYLLNISNDRNMFSCYNYVIRGAFKYKRLDILTKIVDKLHVYSQENCWQQMHNVPEKAFDDFFNLFNDGDFYQNLSVLLDNWVKLKYITNASQISDLISFVERNSRNYSARIGRLVEKGFQMSENEIYKLPIKTFNKKQLESMADQIKKQFILGNDDLAFINLNKINELDKMLAEVKYDYVLDGMNLVYACSVPGSLNLDHVDSVVSELRRATDNPNILIVFKDHMNVFKKQIEFLKKYKNCHFFYLEDVTSQDDKFIVYASLKSGNLSRVVSRDEYKFLYQINTNALRFKEWMNSRRISYTKLQEVNELKLLYPPNYDLKVHKLNSTDWLVPFFSTVTLGPKKNYQVPNKCLLISKNRKNK